MHRPGNRVAGSPGAAVLDLERAQCAQSRLPHSPELNELAFPGELGDERCLRCLDGNVRVGWRRKFADFGLCRGHQLMELDLRVVEEPAVLACGCVDGVELDVVERVGVARREVVLPIKSGAGTEIIGIVRPPAHDRSPGPDWPTTLGLGVE